MSGCHKSLVKKILAEASPSHSSITLLINKTFNSLTFEFSEAFLNIAVKYCAYDA